MKATPVTTRNVTLYWTPVGEPGCEQVHISLGPDGLSALGLILCRKDGTHLRCRYQLDTDPQMRVRELTFAVTDEAERQPKRIVLESDGQGRWRHDGEPAPELEGCIDVDIEVSPVTNTLPIRRLGLAAGKSAEIKAAYLTVPCLQARPAAQRYSCLVPFSEAGGRYRYEGLSSGFTAEIPVDQDGFVLDYPETFNRSWPT